MEQSLLKRSLPHANLSSRFQTPRPPCLQGQGVAVLLPYPSVSNEFHLSTLKGSRRHIPNATGPSGESAKLEQDQERPGLHIPSEGAVQASGEETEAGRNMVAEAGKVCPPDRLHDLSEPCFHLRR